ncbi:MAG TPA: TRAP transporter fused permease subunit [Sedimenticola thiotaurini]|uniref:TRAP transporter fused permease subunit n=1 Tax=Sedimenticola thiotaurini TaxID=1543721 RepID=A0A831W456_9GAMM|nr:TRAP transporter fused permease subunit [Sedimenticola thiotaurini]
MNSFDTVPDSIRPDIEAIREKRVAFWLGVGISLMHLWFNTFGYFNTLDQNMLHFAGFALMCALLYPAARRAPWRAVDILFGLLVLASTLYLLFAEDAIYDRGVRMIASDWAAAFIVIVGAIEYTRRTTGWIIPLLILLALSYVSWWGAWVPGVFRFAGLSLETVVFRSIYGDDALFGNIARISSTFVFMFILFGAFLLRSGAGDFVIHLSRAVAGRVVGGPGMVAVIASGLTGTISGSAVANTASTGVVTIPLMQKAGFSARFAAAVEASASTGGQLMPPIMGAGAFVMASYTQIPYGTIVAVSFVPALLYFVSIMFYVRMEAKRQGLVRLELESEPMWTLVRNEGLSFLVPITLLIGMLVAGFTPTYAAAGSIVAVVVASWFTRVRMGPRAILDALALGARNMVMTAILLCAVGLVVNVIATVGIGNTFSLMITSWAGGSMILAILLVAIASLILGMGLPVTASYIVLATLSAPALYNLLLDAQLVDLIAAGSVGQEARALFTLVAPDAAGTLGQPMAREQAQGLLALVPPDMMGMLREMLVSPASLSMALLTAHMIIFWLSQDSNVTPPVALCAFTAAAIARTSPMATGFTSWKVAKGLYIMPLLFAYSPLLSGDWPRVLETALFAMLGIYAFTASLQGWLGGRIGLLQRGLAMLLALGLLWPAPVWLHLGSALLLVALWYHRGFMSRPGTLKDSTP